MKLPPQAIVVFERIDSMSLRERAMVAATVLALLWALWDALLMRPLNALEDARQAQLASVAGQLADVNRSIQSVSVGTRRPPGPTTAIREPSGIESTRGRRSRSTDALASRSEPPRQSMTDGCAISPQSVAKRTSRSR